ncbi:MAG: hypothetical protein HYU66_07225 [Armatimonadetes bacterium]|nr:hypothetical protein [Armatimonadota bacterium]
MESRSPAREVSDLAWWAWLTTPDDGLAERLAEYHCELPPWLDPVRWCVLGLVAGALLGGLAGGVAVRLGLPLAQGLGVTLLVALFLGLALAHRTARERAGHFAYRLAAVALLLPYMLLGGVVQAVLVDRFLTVGTRPEGCTSTDSAVLGLLLLLLLAAARAADPFGLVEGETDPVWPPVADMPSLAVRTVVLLGLLALGVTSERLGGGRALLVAPALVLLFTARLQERLVRKLALRLARHGLRRRAWPPRFEPPAFALEAALLGCDEEPATVRLASDYCDRRGYSPEGLDEALRALTPGEWTPRRVLAAALCALELWTRPEAGREAAYRAWLRLDLLAGRYGEHLEQGAFLDRFEAAVTGRAQHAAGLVFLAEHGEPLGLPAERVWARWRQLDWLGALAHTAGAERRKLCETAFALVAETGLPHPAAELLNDLDVCTEEHGASEAEEAEWARRGLALAEARGAAACDPEALGHHQPVYPLALRRAAWRLALAADPAPELVRRWYAAARAFEDLPRVRREELLPPAAYHHLWAMVLRRVDDPEERQRQREVYHATRGKRGTGSNREAV